MKHQKLLVRRGKPRPDDVWPSTARRHSVTSTITKEEREALKARAEAQGISTTKLATSIIREYLATPPLNPDDFEDSPNMYAAEEEGV